MLVMPSDEPVVFSCFAAERSMLVRCGSVGSTVKHKLSPC